MSNPAQSQSQESLNHKLDQKNTPSSDQASQNHQQVSSRRSSKFEMTTNLDNQKSPRLSSVNTADFKHLVPNRSPVMRSDNLSNNSTTNSNNNPVNFSQLDSINMNIPTSPRSSVYMASPYSDNSSVNPNNNYNYNGVNGNANMHNASISSASSQHTEHVIDLMEKEQEAIVLKLMKEIQSLKDENKQLKQQLAKYAPNSSLLTTSPSGSISNTNGFLSNPTNLGTGGGVYSRHGSISSNSSSISRSSSQRRSTIGGATANSLLNTQRSLPVPNYPTGNSPFTNYSINQSYVFPNNNNNNNMGDHEPTEQLRTKRKITNNHTHNTNQIQNQLQPQSTAQHNSGDFSYSYNRDSSEINSDLAFYTTVPTSTRNVDERTGSNSNSSRLSTPSIKSPRNTTAQIFK